MNIFRKALVIENGLIVVFAFLVLVTGAAWEAIHFSDSNPRLQKEAEDQWRNDSAAIRRERTERTNEKEISARFTKQLQDNIEGLTRERNQLQETVNRLKAGSSDTDQVRQENSRLKADLGQLQKEVQSLRSDRSARPASTGVETVGPSKPAHRCSEEFQGKPCPSWLPAWGHEPPCGPREARMGLPVPHEFQQAGQYMRDWCQPH